MPYPYPVALPPVNPAAYAIDQFGASAEFTPYVGRSTAGALAPGQTLISCSGRVQTSSSATVSVPLLTVPASKTWFETDFNLSSIGAVELHCQVQAGGITVDNEVTSSTSPINIVHETQPFAPGGTAVVLLLPQTSGGAQYVDFMVAGYFQANPGSY